MELKIAATNRPVNVTSGDLQPVQCDVSTSDPDIHIVQLLPGQQIHIKAHVRMGNGLIHRKWSPVTAVYFNYTPNIISNVARPEVWCSDPQPVTQWPHVDTKPVSVYDEAAQEYTFVFETAGQMSPRATFQETLQTFLEKVRCMHTDVGNLTLASHMTLAARV